MVKFRVATYNVHKFVGADGRWNAERIMNVISALDADILGIQEFTVDPRIARAPSAEEFAAVAGYRVVRQKLRRRNGDYQFNLLLSRDEPRDVRLVDLIVEGREARGAICARMGTGTDSFRVVTTHLALHPTARRRQLEILLESLSGETEEPLLLFGDFNASIPYGPVDRKWRREFPGLDCPATFPARWPVAALDRITARPTSLLRNVHVHSLDPARIASDHLPLVAEIALP